MARPRKPLTLSVEEQGALNLVSWGWITPTEAARMLQVDRSTMTRMCAAVGVDPAIARRAYLRARQISLTRYGHRRMSKADMTARGERALAEWKRDSPKRRR